MFSRSDILCLACGCTGDLQFDVNFRIPVRGRKSCVRALSGPEPEDILRVYNTHDDLAKTRAGDERAEAKYSEEFRLFELFDDPKYNVGKLSYVYNYQHQWHHTLTVEGRDEAHGKFVCLSEFGYYAAEGLEEGPDGPAVWTAMKEAFNVENLNWEQRYYRKWFMRSANNREPLGLTGDRVHFFDREKVNQELLELPATIEKMMENDGFNDSKYHSGSDVRSICDERSDYTEDDDNHDHEDNDYPGDQGFGGEDRF